jgi:hypothetical protein
MSDIDGYKRRIDNFYETMEQNIDIIDIKLSEEKWTLKEMIGHLIDSASRFI